MKIYFAAPLAAAVALAGPAPAVSAAPTVTAATAAPGLHLPAARKVKLKNGMTLLLLEQHEVPMVSLNASIRAGSVLDPPGKEGLASLAAGLLLKGTSKRSAVEIAQAVDFAGGRLDCGASLDRATCSADFMAKDAALAVELLADVLQRPTFPEDEVKKLVARRADALKSKKDDARAVVRDYFDAYLFAGHPYGRPEEGDERSVNAVTAEAVRAFHRDRFAPSEVTLAVVGDFKTAEMEKRLRDGFGGWNARPTKAMVAAPPEVPPGKRLLLVDKPDSTQTFFLIGGPGIARTDPDRVALDVVNTVFGGRFTSILNNALRIESGLTYGARSGFERHQAPGSFAISTFTRNETTEKAIDMTLDLLGKLHRDGLTAEQLQSAKEYIKGQYPTRIETSDQLAAQLTELDFYGLGSDEIDQYFARVDSVTLDDIRRVVKAHYPLDNLTFTLVGKAAEIGETVKKYAPKVEVRPIIEPGYR